jgi:vitamin B12 transporter
MKKRGIFSLVLLLALSPLAAAQDITDLGTAYELVIAETPLAESETNTASSVSVITEQQIASYHAQTTAELIGKAIGTSFNSYGSLGSLQNVVIRGATSSKNLIYLDGVLLSSAHDGTVDLSIIPVDIIDHIEIIKSGPGNLGRTNAIGGMVNIITKQGAKTGTPFSLTLENGSYLPLAYGSADTRNYRSLVDSQKLDLSYTAENLVATIGGLTARNAYTYDDGTDIRNLRENAQVNEAHGSVRYTQALSDALRFDTQNLFAYKNLGVPGSYSYGLTPNDYQNDLFFTTNNTFNLSLGNRTLDAATLLLGYTYGQTFYHDDDYLDSTHDRHKATIQLQEVWNMGEHASLTTDAQYNLDYVDSTDVGKNTRHTLSVSANGSRYFADGRLSLHPSLNLAYLSDLSAISPNASLGAIYTLAKHLDLKATLSYAENVPSFSQLYWPFMGNANLKTEKGVNADVAISAKTNRFTYEGTVFGRNIYNAIAYDAFWVPQNIAHSIYLGTEQTATLALSERFSLQVSYQYNKSFDLSNGKTIADDIEVANIRKHTAKASLFFSLNRFAATLSAEYLGKTSSLEQALLLNLSTSMQLKDGLEAYLAVDNLLNTSYALASGGYPMPGIKIRIGGTLRF